MIYSQLITFVQRPEKYDAVIIETTGMADPAPVAFTFNSKPEVRPNFRFEFSSHEGDDIRKLSSTICAGWLSISRRRDLVRGRRETHSTAFGRRSRGRRCK